MLHEKVLIKILKSTWEQQQQQQKSHSEISQTQSLYTLMNFSTIRISILKMWNCTLDS